MIRRLFTLVGQTIALRGLPPSAHQSVEAFVEECEEAHRDLLLAQKERGERGFREGRFTSWDEVKRRNNL